jgi:TonB family protein
MMKQLMILALICCLMPLVAMAQQPPNPPQRWDVPPPPPPPAGSGKWWKNSATVRALELSESQVQQLEAVYLGHQKDLATLRSTLLQQESGLKALLTADRLDEAALAAQRAQLTAARVELEKQNSEMTLAMRRLMTGDQWRRLEKIREANLQPPAPPPPPPPPPPPRKDAGADEKVYDAKTTAGMKVPVPISQTKPAYTAEAREAKVEGVVLLELIIRKDGSVGSVKVLKGLGYGLDESAVETVKTQWRFQPALLKGQPVNVHANVEISFRTY